MCSSGGPEHNDLLFHCFYIFIVCANQPSMRKYLVSHKESSIKVPFSETILVTNFLPESAHICSHTHTQIIILQKVNE